jgi:hypothetical protein
VCNEGDKNIQPTQEDYIRMFIALLFEIRKKLIKQQQQKKTA